jgi:4-carboxymuconolactone decarboxylase
MARLKIMDRGEMNPEQANVYDAAKNAGGPVGGPFYAYIRLPKLFEAAQHLRNTLGEGPLSARERLIVNLTVARYWNAQYPWYAQARNARAGGIPPAAIDAINARRTPDLTDARERTCYGVAHDMLADKGLSDAAYEAAERTLGLEHLVALVAAVGSFTMTCLTAGTFQVPPPADNPTPLAS